MPLDVLGRTRATLTGPAGRAFAPAPRPRGAGQSRQAPSCWGQSVAIVALERGIPSRRGSSARADYVPALCTHRPSLLPIGRPGEASGPAGGRSATTARGREAVRTWSPRGSKSRNKVSVGEPAEGSLQGGAGPSRPANSFSSFSSPSAAFHAATALQETSSEFLRPPGEAALPALPREVAPGGPSTTPGNGSLGSGVDEERGDMRYVVRIAGTQRAIESSNAHRARRQPGGPARPSAASERPSPRPVRGGVGTRGGGQPAARAQIHVPCVARGRPRLAARPPGAPEPPPPGTRRVQHSSPARSPGGAAGGGRRWGAVRTRASNRRPRIGQGYPLNLSISVSGGKETNRDCPSSGERRGNSPALKSGPPHAGGPSCSLEREPPPPARRAPRGAPAESPGTGRRRG